MARAQAKQQALRARIVAQLGERGELLTHAIAPGAKRSEVLLILQQLVRDRVVEVSRKNSDAGPVFRYRLASRLGAVMTGPRVMAQGYPPWTIGARFEERGGRWVLVGERGQVIDRGQRLLSKGLLPVTVASWQEPNRLAPEGTVSLVGEPWPASDGLSGLGNGAGGSVRASVVVAELERLGATWAALRERSGTVAYIEGSYPTAAAAQHAVTTLQAKYPDREILTGQASWSAKHVFVYARREMGRASDQWR